jgi:hypothetical protein
MITLKQILKNEVVRVRLNVGIAQLKRNRLAATLSGGTLFYEVSARKQKNIYKNLYILNVGDHVTDKRKLALVKRQCSYHVYTSRNFFTS